MNLRTVVIILLMISMPVGASYVPNVITSAGTKERVERAKITLSGGTPSITTQSGSWLSSVTDGGVGLPQPQITANTFSAAPVCVCSTAEDNSSGIECSVQSTSTSNVLIRTRNNSGTLTDETVSLICMGPR